MNPEEINNQQMQVPTLFNTPQFCYTLKELPALNFEDFIKQNQCNDVIMGSNNKDQQILLNNNFMNMKLQLPPSKSQISLLSSLSASQNEVSEKDRTISNETVGLNSTTELTPKASNKNGSSANLFQREASYSPFRNVEFSERQVPLSTEKPLASIGLYLNKIDDQNKQGFEASYNGGIKRNLFNQNPQQPMTPTSTSNDRTLRDIKNFKMMGKVGEGAYGQVWSALHNPSQRLYAIKVIQKSRVEKLDKVHEIQNEKNILSRLKHPNIVKLHSTFTDSKNVYMVLDYAINGDFSQYLKLNKILTEKQAQFYVAQLINILGFLRSKNIIHRDLKPGNILFDDNWHLILADFGTAKILTNKGSNASTASTQNKSLTTSNNNSTNTTPKNNGQTNTHKLETQNSDLTSFSTAALTRGIQSSNDMIGLNNQLQNIQNNMDELLSNADMDQESKGSFVGTEDYVCPEIINNQEPTFASDLWSLGIMVYQYFTGKTPFKGVTPFYTFENILACEYHMPETMPEKARSLIKQLLVLDPILRLGAGDADSCNGIEALKSHPFFDGVNFSTLHSQQAPIDSRKVIQSPLKRQLMQYLPSSQSSKGKNLTQEFTKDNVNSETNSTVSVNGDVKIRDFSDLVKLQKTPSNQNVQNTQEFVLNDLKLLKFQSTQNFEEVKGPSLLKLNQSLLDSPAKRKLKKKTTSNLDVRSQLVFKSHAALLKQSSLIKDSDLFFDDCLDCISLWKESKSEMVKKKTKLIFYADRIVKLYENGYFAYFTSKQKDLKAVIHPREIISCVIDSKDKMKLSTKEKSYLFKFNDSKVAQEWVTTLNNSMKTYQE